MIRSRPTSALPLLLVLVLVSWPAWGAPSHQDPEAPLMVRPEEESRQLQAAARSLDEKARASVTAFLEKLAEDRLSQVKPEAIGQTHVAIIQLQRLAQRLIRLGEPAGEDFRLRMMDLEKDHQSVIAAYRRLPGVPERISRDYEALRREAKSKAAVLGKVEQLAGRQEWEEAELREMEDGDF